MSEFKEKIPAAGGKVEYLYDSTSGIAAQISGSGFMALYQVAISMDGLHLLGTIPATGIGVTPVYPQPSVITFIQSDQQGMWGRNCPRCKKYFRTNHIMGVTCCPYCAAEASGLAFISKDQRTYITACYDAFARARIGKKSTSVEIADITDQTPAWHYSEEKLQIHFRCDAKDCRTETDILGEYGYCPRCGTTNARKLFLERMDKMLVRVEEVTQTISDRKEQDENCEKLTVSSLSEFEALGRHLRLKLLLFPMTPNRRKQVLGLSFQRPFETDTLLLEWFDIGLLKWPGDASSPARSISQGVISFVKQMIQKRHILMHNGGVVDQDYLEKTGDTQVRLNERISIRSYEVKRFIEHIREMGAILMDNVERGFSEAES